MTLLLAIDPGVDVCAYAVIEEECLVRVGFLPPADFAFQVRFSLIDTVIVERPEYQGARSDAADTQTLIDLTASAMRAAYTVGGRDVQEFTPRQWKGSEAKPPHHLRLWEDCLKASERALFPAGTEKRIRAAAEKYALNPGKYPSASAYGRGKGSEVHNLLDAAAFGLWHVGMFR